MARVLDFRLFCFVPSRCNILQWTFGVSFSSLGNEGLDLGFALLDDNEDGWSWVEGGGGGGGGGGGEHHTY